MKINKIKINSFGNLKNKDIKLENGINIIYGKNESGKSTLLKFIINMFYGISKNKRGKNISDYDKFKPWDSQEFSGNLEYELDNKNNYEIFRDFNKKNPKIFNNNHEEISKEYITDKSIGNLFFYEQTGLDEDMFTSSIACMQKEVILEKNIQNNIIQKIANIMGSGDDSISYKKAIDKLEKKQLEEIGTDRSVGRPINILKNKLIKIENEKKQLINNNKNKINEIKNNLQEKIKKLEIKYEIIKKIKINNQENKINLEKINFNKKIINENSKKIIELNGKKIKINELNEEKDINKKINEEKSKINKIKINSNKIGIFLVVLSILLTIIIFMKTQGTVIKNLCLCITPIIIAILIILNIIAKNKISDITIKEKNIEIDEKNKSKEIDLINNEIKLLENNINNFNNEINSLNKKIIEKNNEKKEEIILNYKNELSESELLQLLNENNLEKLEENIEKELSGNKMKLYQIELEEKETNSKLERLSTIEEEIQVLNEQLDELNYKNDVINIAKEGLKTAYEKMKNTVTPKFTEVLSSNISKISNGKYKMLTLNDEYGLVVQIENGDYIPADRLSTGTIDELYLSLRIAIMRELTEQNMPIILDEAFAYFDDERLTNILEYINTEFSEKQTIILTCTNREKNIMDNIGIHYNSIQI